MFRSALSRIGSADAIVEQSIVGEELAQGAHVSAREGSNLRPSGRKAKNPTTEPLRHAKTAWVRGNSGTREGFLGKRPVVGSVSRRRRELMETVFGSIGE